MASAPQTIPLRFQRRELQQKANLSSAGVLAVAGAAGPRELLAALPDDTDAVAALAMMLPRRQAVWWACLAVRLLPMLRPEEALAVEAAEAWVQSQAPEDSERAGALAEACDAGAPAHWAAVAAHWSGASLASSDLPAVPPAPHLAGVATRAALGLALLDPAMVGVLAPADLLAIGTDLMHGDLGRKRQAALRDRLTVEAG